MRFDDRESAGLLLAHRLQFLAGDDLVVVGLARGGVMVASAVARTLKAPLDTVIVAKVTAPQAPDVALGAIAEVDHTNCPHPLRRMRAVEDAYLDFPKLHDTEVLATLRLHANSLARRSARPRTAIASAPASVSCSSTG